MKKLINFLKCLVIPRQMGKLANTKFIISMLIILATSIIMVSTVPISGNNCIDQMVDEPIQVGLIGNDVEFDEAFSGLEFENGEFIGETKVYHSSSMSTGENKKIVDVYVVCDANQTEDGKLSTLDFDLTGYLKQEKKDDHVYVLYVFTKSYCYIEYDLESLATSETVNTYTAAVYEVDDEGNVKYYLPKDDTEIANGEFGIDTTLWTLNASYGETTEIGGVIYKAEARYNDSIYRTLYGKAYDYPSLIVNGFDPTLLTSNVHSFTSHFYDAQANLLLKQLEVYSVIVSLFLGLVLGLIMPLLSYLISKQYLMNKFRQYYAIYAFCSIPVSLVGAIVGIFVPYINIAMFYVIANIVWFFVCTLQINQMQNLTDGDLPKTPKDNKPTNQTRNTETSDVAQIG